MKKKVFLKNTLILTVTSLILRTIGIFFRIYLSDKIGAEGMGLYQLIISVYVLGSTFAVAGISTAVTRLVADELVCGTARSVRHILRRSVALSGMIGVVSTAIIYFGAPYIAAGWLKDERATEALKMLSFSLPSMGISSCIKGYFTARRRVGCSSRAQIVEQIVRIGLLFITIDRFAFFGLAAACFAVMLADTVAEWVSCLYVAVGYAIDRRRLKRETAGIPPHTRRVPVVRQLLSIATPITAGRYLNTALRTVENILVPNNIARYCGSRETGLSQFGALKGMALPLLFFPASFLSAMSTLLIPELSAANAEHQQGAIQRAVEKTLRVTFASAMLIGGIFTAFAEPIGVLFYDSREVGVFLRVLAPLIPIMYAESMVDGMLKGLNQQVSSLKYSVADSAVRIVLILLVVPYHGMAGFLFIMVVSNVLTSFLNLNRLLTVTKVKFRFLRMIGLPLLAVLVASAVALGITQCFDTLSPLMTTVVGGVCLSVVYGVFLLLCGCHFPLDMCKKKRYDG